MPVLNQPQDVDHCVLVDANVLRRMMSCTDGLLDIFQGATEHSILDTRSLLCEHGAGKLLRTLSSSSGHII
jgi:hypothetical protein